MKVAYWSWMIVEFGLLIWGSVVVFGAWPTWTYEDYDYDFVQLGGYADYCPYSPMMFAFVLLILKWVSGGHSTLYLQFIKL